VASEETHPLTFLFTDIEASTRLWEEHPVAMSRGVGWQDSVRIWSIDMLSCSGQPGSCQRTRADSVRQTEARGVLPRSQILNRVFRVATPSHSGRATYLAKARLTGVVRGLIAHLVLRRLPDCLLGPAGWRLAGASLRLALGCLHRGYQ
jgi:hypothetical protein